jgi:hypothetical protein
MNNKYIFGSSLVVIVLIAAISAIFLLKNEAQPAVQVQPAKKTVMAKEMSILVNSKDAAKLLGITEDQLKRIIFLENHQLEQSGSFDGTMLPYITMNEEYYFNTGTLLKWAAEAAEDHRDYDAMAAY